MNAGLTDLVYDEFYSHHSEIDATTLRELAEIAVASFYTEASPSDPMPGYDELVHFFVQDQPYHALAGMNPSKLANLLLHSQWLKNREAMCRSQGANVRAHTVGDCWCGEHHGQDDFL